MSLVQESREKMLADLKKYVDMDLDELLSQLTEEEIDELNSENDPDVSFLIKFICIRVVSYCWNIHALDISIYAKNGIAVLLVKNGRMN